MSVFYYLSQRVQPPLNVAKMQWNPYKKSDFPENKSDPLPLDVGHVKTGNKKLTS